MAGAFSTVVVDATEQETLSSSSSSLVCAWRADCWSISARALLHLDPLRLTQSRRGGTCAWLRSEGSKRARTQESAMEQARKRCLQCDQRASSSSSVQQRKVAHVVHTTARVINTKLPFSKLHSTWPHHITPCATTVLAPLQYGTHRADVIDALADEQASRIALHCNSLADIGRCQCVLMCAISIRVRSCSAKTHSKQQQSSLVRVASATTTTAAAPQRLAWSRRARSEVATTRPRSCVTADLDQRTVRTSVGRVARVAAARIDKSTRRRHRARYASLTGWCCSDADKLHQR